jgi:excisionase family DNA binding protein
MARRAANSSEREFMTVQEVADYLGVSRTTLYETIFREPDFPSLYVGSRRLIRRSSLEAWIARHEKNTATEVG